MLSLVTYAAICASVTAALFVGSAHVPHRARKTDLMVAAGLVVSALATLILLALVLA